MKTVAAVVLGMALAAPASGHDYAGQFGHRTGFTTARDRQSHTHRYHHTPSHNHDALARASHGHTGYASQSHAHRDLATARHPHDDLAPLDHRHEEVPEHVHESPGAASGSRFEVPFFGPAPSCIHAATDAERCDNPPVNSFLHIVNFGTAAADVTITGKDATGAGGTRIERAIPAGGSRRVRDHVLEGETGFDFNGVGVWSLVVTSTSSRIRLAAFSNLGNPAGGFTSLPVHDAPLPATGQ